MASLHIDEAEVVGIDEPKEKLVGWLTNDELRRVVISVVAMGGMGKTTLVKKVYDHGIVKNSFDCFDFVVVSKTYSVIEIIRDLIKKMHEQRKSEPPSGLDRMNKFHELVPLLKAYLQDKRYVIVFDDVWDSELWEEIQFAFPVNSYGRIIITTREVSVAQSCTLKSGHLYELQPLKDDEAWDLFSRTVFPSDRCCPKELEELSRNFVKFCQGLPLAIVAIGGMLAVKDKTMSEWERVRRGGFGMYDEREHTIVNMKRIILLSYNDLPYYLKSCFLYLSLFPEDYNIKFIELQKLCFVDVGGRDSKSGQIKELRKLTQLKRLGIIKLRTEDGRDLCDAIQNMESLLSFSVASSHENELLDLCLSQPPKLLQRVYLKGMLESLPSWITMLQNLVTLVLRCSKLKDDPFESLQNLPNLVKLELCGAYDGNELRCGEGGFKKLKVLDIINLKELKVVEIGEGAMCGLQQLCFQECPQLEKVPLGIEYIANLKVLMLAEMSEELYSRVRKDGGEDHPRIQHTQIIKPFYKDDGEIFFTIL